MIYDVYIYDICIFDYLSYYVINLEITSIYHVSKEISWNIFDMHHIHQLNVFDYKYLTY